MPDTRSRTDLGAIILGKFNAFKECSFNDLKAEVKFT